MLNNDEGSFERFRSDSDFIQAAAKLDKAQFNDALGTATESLTTLINFESYKRSVQFLKGSLKKLSPDTEALYKDRVEQAVKVYRTNLGAAETMSKLLSSSGFEGLLERHHKAIFQLTPSGPLGGRLSRFLSNIGASDSDISHLYAQLRAKDENPFRFGTNGKLSGMVQPMKEQLATVENELEAVKRHGVPIVEGAGPVLLVVAVMVVVGVASCMILNNIQYGDCGLGI